MNDEFSGSFIKFYSRFQEITGSINVIDLIKDEF
jgi:hypothetical protein